MGTRGHFWATYYRPTGERAPHTAISNVFDAANNPLDTSVTNTVKGWFHNRWR